MSEKDAKQWRKLTALFPPCDEEKELACQLYQQFIKGQPWQLSFAQIIDLPLPVVFDFYYRLALFTTPGRIYSRKQTTNWFASMHVNVIDLRKISGWVGLLKIAPMFANECIALDPFCTCSSNESSLVRSHITLDPLLHSSILEQNDIALEFLLTMVFEALRRLKIATGFVLYPFVSSDAIVCQKKPEMFYPNNTVTQDERTFFNLENQESIEYLGRITEHYRTSYGFDFVYYPLDLSAKDVPLDTLKTLENMSENAIPFAVLGASHFAVQEDSSTHLLPLSTEYLPLAKMKIQASQPRNLRLLHFLGQYTNIFPYLFHYNGDQFLPTKVFFGDYPLLPSFDNKNTCLNFNGYTLWIWGSKHRICILMAIWEDQEVVEVDLQTWVRTQGFYQKILWNYTDSGLQQESDELVSSSLISFSQLVAGNAKVILFNI